jgi:ribonuclease Z
MESITRRKFIGIGVAAGSALLVSAPAESATPGAKPRDFKVTTLGTGAPPPEIERFGPSTLVQAAGQYLLFDVGRGALQRLAQLKVPASAIDRVFITHLHSDHTVGLPDLYLTGMLSGPFGSRKKPFRITGVEGAREMMDYMKLAYSADSKIRIEDGELQPAWTEIETTEFTRDGVVYEKDGVKVTAFENFHGEAIKPSFGFRIDYDGRSAVISGDTKYYPNVVKYAKGVDLLIHSVGAANADLLKQDTDAAKKARIILNHHTPPEDAAKVFNEAKPKLAVFTHMVVVATDPKYPRPTQESIVASTRAAGYSGPLEIARDLMSFEIGDAVSVVPFGK